MNDKQSGVAAVERALSIINAFGPGDSALTLHDLAERTGLYKSTILRLIVTLTQSHCIKRLDDGRYQLGSMLLHWGSLYQSSLRLDDHVLPVLHKLVEHTLEGASFFTREADVRVCLFRVDSPRSVRDHVRAGDLLPLDKGAAGRVLKLFDAQITPPAQWPSSPIVFTIGEREPDIAAISVPVFGPAGSLRGALAVSGPSVRFDEDAVKKISRHLLEAAADLTRQLGGNPNLLSVSGNAQGR